MTSFYSCLRLLHKIQLFLTGYINVTALKVVLGYRNSRFVSI